MPRGSKSMKRETRADNMELSTRSEVKLLLQNRKRRQDVLIDEINTHYDNMLVDIPEAILNKPISQLTSDDIYKIKNAGNTDNSTTEKSTSLPRGAKKASKTRLALPQKKMNKLQTPANLGLPPNVMGTVTPKFNPYAPMPVVRVPKEGEVAMSLTGSPLRVTAAINEFKPNLIVPLHNGKILSVLPERGMRLSQVPEINEEILDQLKVLNDNLNTLLSKPSKDKD